MFRDELAGWLSGMNQYKKAGGGDRTFWQEAYCGSPYTVERLSRPPARIPNLSVSLAGGIQPDRLNTMLMGQDDDGLMARLCPVWPLVPPYKQPEREPDNTMANRAFARLCRLEMLEDAHGVPAPAVVPLTGPAVSKLETYCQSVRDGEDGQAGLLKSFIGKTPGMVVRIAHLLAMLEWASGDEGAPPAEIGIEYVERALMFVSDYLVPMARRAYAESAMPPDERAARTLARAIVERGVPNLTKDDVRTMQLEGLRKSADISAAIQVLVEANIFLESKADMGRPGRPRLEYVVNPRVWTQGNAGRLM